MTEVIPVYLGEAMLTRWSDNHRGRTVTFQLEMEAGENPFRGYKCGDSGQRVKLCAVLVGDDEEPVMPKTAATQVGTTAKVGTEVQSEKPSAKKPLTPSQVAALKCRDQSFQEWLGFERKAIIEQFTGMDPGNVAYDHANAFLKTELGIESKRELDFPGPAQERWFSLLATYDHRDLIR